ncbi:MAG: carboxypeptidase-like regulatory domain-containing protein [Candidatus Acidiferrum sp.]
MKEGLLRGLGALVLVALVSAMLPKGADAQNKPAAGVLSGVVRDASGTPQMGASVEVLSEAVGFLAAQDFLTNTRGIFLGEKLPPGLYTVRVTLAGFLPTIEQHVRISPNLTTVVRIEMESMFASLDRMRRQPANLNAESDDWKWVLRSAPSLRPALEWTDNTDWGSGAVSASLGGVVMDNSVPRPVRMRLEFTDGARQLASPSNIAPAPATAFAYDQSLSGMGRMILAGQMSYDDDAPGGGLATIWLPSGTLDSGPHTALVLREAKSSPDGPVFRGVRIDQGGALGFGDRAVLQYGSEYVLVGLGRAASAIRPRMQLEVRATEHWRAALIFASLPGGPTLLGEAQDLSAQERQDAQGAELTAALNELDAFPALLWRNGRPELQAGWHEEAAVERQSGAHSKLQIAAFHDDQNHVAVYGRGSGLPAADYLQDFYGNGFAYDGGSSSSWGGRVAWTEKINDNLELTAIYAYGGALIPAEDVNNLLRDVLRTENRHSAGANISGKVPRLGTRLESGYKWVGGPTVSHVDLYGESLYQMEPFFHFGVRQPLPQFGLGRWEAVAECDNLFAQGYVPAGSRDGQVALVPTFRSFRGGLSVQF